MAKFMEDCRILTRRELSRGIIDLTLLAPGIASAAHAGQFVNLFLLDRTRILPRPISLCGIDRGEETIRVVFRVTGEKRGTAELASYPAGTELRVLGPLGNGFPEDLPDVTAVGGGIGVFPLLQLLKELPGKKEAVLGYRSSDALYLKEEFEAAAPLVIATEDGSLGVRGTVIDALNAREKLPETILACGPMPMLRSLKAWAAERGVPLYVSVEARMACGVGACLGCVIRSTEVDGHSLVKNKRVCREGPVFRAEEVEL